MVRPESRVSLSIKISNESYRCLHSLRKRKKESISNVCKRDRLSIEREVGEWIEATRSARSLSLRNNVSRAKFPSKVFVERRI